MNLDYLRKAVKHEAAAVSNNGLVIISNFLQESEVRVAIGCIVEILDIYFRYPRRNVFHSGVVNMLCFILKQEKKSFLPLKEKLFRKAELIPKMKNALRENKEYYMGGIRLIAQYVPDSYKDDDWKENEVELFKLPGTSLWEVPDKVMKKKRELKGIMVDTEQTYLNPISLVGNNKTSE